MEQARSFQGQALENLEDALGETLEGGPGQVIALKGLSRVLMKKIKTLEVQDDVFRESRAKTFDLAVEAMNRGEVSFPIATPRDLYGDLPGRRPIEEIPDWTPAQFLERYNLELCSGLVARASELVIALSSPSQRELRYLWSCLKFFGLLARVEEVDDELHFRVEGPLEGLGGEQRYRKRCAMLTGILPNFERGRLQGFVRLDRSEGWLSLPSRGMLRTHYPRFFDHTPQEWKLFLETLREKLPEGWQEESSAEIPLSSLLKGLTPDLSLVHRGGQRMLIGFFFRHQRGGLKTFLHRADWSGSKGHWLLLVERPLLEIVPEEHRDQAISFTSIPSVRKVQSMLKQWPLEGG